MNKIIVDKAINKNVQKIQTSYGELYIANRVPHIESKSPLIDNSRAGQWRLKIAVYQTHRLGKPIKAKVQRPRWKHLDYFETLDKCREYIKGVSNAKVSGVELHLRRQPR